jgi:hypothetical protein
MLKPESQTEAFFQGTAEDLPEEFSYKALSRAAILSVFFGAFGLLAWFSPLLTVLPFLAALFSGLAFYNLKKYPAELTGKLWATIGGVLGFVLLFGAPAKHAYIYLTEVPEGYERISFAALKSPMGAPDVPTLEAMKLSGKKIFLKGYIHPTSLASMSSKTFVLVPDWATCCFGTQPPLTHMIEVRLVNDKFASRSYRQHSLAGTFEVMPQMKQVDGLTGVYYVLEAEHFQ